MANTVEDFLRSLRSSLTKANRHERYCLEYQQAGQQPFCPSELSGFYLQAARFGIEVPAIRDRKYNPIQAIEEFEKLERKAAKLASTSDELELLRSVSDELGNMPALANEIEKCANSLRHSEIGSDEFREWNGYILRDNPDDPPIVFQLVHQIEKFKSCGERLERSLDLTNLLEVVKPAAMLLRFAYTGIWNDSGAVPDATIIIEQAKLAAAKLRQFDDSLRSAKEIAIAEASMLEVDSELAKTPVQTKQIKKKKRGPKPKRDLEKDRKLVKDFKSADTKREDFCRKRGIKITDLENARRNVHRKNGSA